MIDGKKLKQGLFRTAQKAVKVNVYDEYGRYIGGTSMAMQNYGDVPQRAVPAGFALDDRSLRKLGLGRFDYVTIRPVTA